MPRVMTIGRIGKLGDCACQHKTAGVRGVRDEAPILAGTARRGKKRSRKGKHCVASKRGKIFNCYSSLATARRIAKKMGKGFRVKR